MNDEVLDLAQATLECMAGAAQVRSALVAKVASLQEENDRLKANAVNADAVKQLASALAAHGAIDRFNEAYFTKSASDADAGKALARLLEILPKQVAKQASTGPSPFQVDTRENNAPSDQANERAYQARLAKLAKKA